MKTINTIARIANNNLNTNTINNSIVKEDTSMKINTIANTVSCITRSARRAASLLAFGGLLALTHSAKADIEVYRFVPPAQAMFVPAGSTYMEVKVGNTSNFTVSGLQITIPLDTPLLAQLHGLPDYYDVTSTPFSLGPNESKWIYIPVPARGMMGTPFYGQQLSGGVWINDHFYQNVAFQDVAAAANVQANVRMTGQNPNTGTNTYSVTFTNNGYADAAAQTAVVSTWQYGDGQVGAAKTQTLNIPALAVGKSVTLTFTSQPTMGYDIKGNITINNKVVATL